MSDFEEEIFFHPSIVGLLSLLSWADTAKLQFHVDDAKKETDNFLGSKGDLANLITEEMLGIFGEDAEKLSKSFERNPAQAKLLLLQLSQHLADTLFPYLQPRLSFRNFEPEFRKYPFGMNVNMIDVWKKHEYQPLSNF